MRVSSMLLATATTVAGLAAGVPAMASAAQPHQAAPAVGTAHVYQFIKAHHSGKDLAVENASTAAGAHIVQFTRNTGHGQEWEVINLPSPPSNVLAPDRQFKSRLSGLCLDVAGNSLAAGALVVQNPCNAADPAQRWSTTKVASIFSPNGGFRRYTNRNSGLAMDIGGAETGNGAHLIQFPAKGDNQLFEQSLAEVVFD